MNFIKNFFSKDTPADNETKLEQSVLQAKETLDNPPNSPEKSQSAPTSVNLMSKLFRTPKLSVSEPPEMLHENEAWAPETGYVGLFRKRKINTKEDTFSNPQE